MNEIRPIDRVTAELKRRGMSQAAFASEIAETSQVVTNRKKRGMPASAYRKTAAALGWSVAQLLGEATSPGENTSIQGYTAPSLNPQPIVNSEIPLKVQFISANLTDVVLLLGGFLEAMNQEQRESVEFLLHKLIKHPDRRHQWAPLVGAVAEAARVTSGSTFVDRLMRTNAQSVEKQRLPNIEHSH